MYAWRLRNLHNSYSYMINGKKSYLHFPVLWIICMYLNVLESRVHPDCIITSSHALHINADEIEYIVVLFMFKTLSPFTPSKCGMKINIINVINERFNYTYFIISNEYVRMRQKFLRFVFHRCVAKVQDKFNSYWNLRLL